MPMPADAASSERAAWHVRHRHRLAQIGYTLAFIALFGGIAMGTYRANLAPLVSSTCPPACSGIHTGQIAIALAMGAFAVLVTWLYARALLAFEGRRKLQQPPITGLAPQRRLSMTAIVGYYVLGLVLIGIVGAIAFSMQDRDAVRFGWEPVLGWWFGGRGALGYFTSRSPA